MQIKDKVIENKVSNFQREIALDLLHDFQDPDFKEAKHKERVKQSIIKHGIVGAVHVWLDTTDDKIYIVDGHTRKDALIELQADGYKLQNTLPCVFLDLANKEEVAKVLLTHNTKTAKINQDALPAFLETYEITLEEAGIEIEELHLTTYDDGEDITPDVNYNNTEIDLDSLDYKGILKLEFTSAEYLEILDKLNNVRVNNESNEALFVKMLVKYVSI